MLRFRLVAISVVLLSSCGDDRAESGDCAELSEQVRVQVAAAKQCDPAVANPCTELYNGCTAFGVRTDTLDALNALYAKYNKCITVMPPCPPHDATLAYVCAANADGQNVCVAADQ